LHKEQDFSGVRKYEARQEEHSPLDGEHDLQLRCKQDSHFKFLAEYPSSQMRQLRKSYVQILQLEMGHLSHSLSIK
jgi:hypothetical protein